MYNLFKKLELLLYFVTISINTINKMFIFTSFYDKSIMLQLLLYLISGGISWKTTKRN